MQTRLAPIVLRLGVVTGVAGVVGALWLTRLGDGLMVLGWVAAIGVAYWTLQTLVRGPRASLIAQAARAFAARQPRRGWLLTSGAFLWTYIVVLGWVAFAFLFAGSGRSADSLPPYALWAFAAATTPWIFLAVSTEDEGRWSDQMAAITSFIGALAGVATLFLPDPTLLYLGLALLAPIAIGFVASLALTRSGPRQLA
jgi:hypothetical protein